MNKYTIFRMPAEDDENYDQHELVGLCRQPSALLEKVPIALGRGCF